jgi:L-lactate dehydrogenase complex protein LldG
LPKNPSIAGGLNKKKETTMSSRAEILARLRAAQIPFPEAAAPEILDPVLPVPDQTVAALTQLFIKEAKALSCGVQIVAGDSNALQAINELLQGQEQIIAWDLQQIPCSGLDKALDEAGISIASPEDDSVLFSITGADAALAATGSLILTSGPGRPRTAALLPLNHIAIITQEQIIPNLEAWMGIQRRKNLDLFHEAANAIIISGPSRTADIAMELILGMHGPANLQIIIIAA